MLTRISLKQTVAWNETPYRSRGISFKNSSHVSLALLRRLAIDTFDLIHASFCKSIPLLWDEDILLRERCNNYGSSTQRFSNDVVLLTLYAQSFQTPICVVSRSFVGILICNVSGARSKRKGTIHKLWLCPNCCCQPHRMGQPPNLEKEIMTLIW